MSRVRRHLSEACQAAAGVAGESVPNWNWDEFRARFWAIEVGNVSAPSVRMEAAAFGRACVGLPLPRRLTSSGRGGQTAHDQVLPQRLGRVCRYCWRTEARAPTGTGPYGLCSRHSEANSVGQPCWVNGAIKIANQRVLERRTLPRPSRLEKQRSARFRAKLGADYLDERGHLREPVVPLREIKADQWHDHIQVNYVEAVCYLGNEYGTFPLWDPIITIEAIEGRDLTAAEEQWYSSPWRREAPIVRCQLWLQLLPRIESDIDDHWDPAWDLRS